MYYYCRYLVSQKTCLCPKTHFSRCFNFQTDSRECLHRFQKELRFSFPIEKSSTNQNKKKHTRAAPSGYLATSKHGVYSVYSRYGCKRFFFFLWICCNSVATRKRSPLRHLYQPLRGTTCCYRLRWLRRVGGGVSSANWSVGGGGTAFSSWHSVQGIRSPAGFTAQCNFRNTP